MNTVAASEFRELEVRVQELDRLPGRRDHGGRDPHEGAGPPWG